VVTGANRGLGLEVATQLARLGLLVVLTARGGRRAATAAGALVRMGLAVRPGALDVTDDASVARLHAAVMADVGRVDVLVNNAASPTTSAARRWAPTSAWSPTTWARTCWADGG
jgi:NAD(P)-dependent dehydrogenase (short-subunit alcohol dehydrogenase family)